MAQSSRWLIIAHSFNMDGRAASLTVTDKIPELQAAGIEVTVISAATGEQDMSVPHYQLMPWGPSGLRFDFRHIMARKYGRGVRYRSATLLVSILLLPFIALERVLFGLSNQASWFLPATCLGLRLVRSGRYDVVYSSGGAASAHHAAAIIKSRTGITWIAEIHDPMIMRTDAEDDGSSPARGRNARYLQRLEARICREADRVWWFTESALAYARQRNPALQDKGFVVLPGCRKPDQAGSHEYSPHLNISHFGAITLDRSLAPLLGAIGRLQASQSQVSHEIQINVFGSALDAASRQAIDQYGLADLVLDRGRLPRRDAVRKMYEADCLLLLHGDYEGCAEYIPSKFYEYLWTRRPILALTNRNPFFDDLLLGHGAYIGHTHDPDSIDRALAELVADWRQKRLSPRPDVPVTVASAVSTILDHVTPAQPLVQADGHSSPQP